MTSRECALKVLNRCTQSGSWSSQTLDSELDRLRSSLQPELAEREASLTSRIVIGVLQNLYLLDYYISLYLSRSGALDVPVQNILRIGAYQLRFMDRIPKHAAVNECVGLCRKAGFGSASGLVNAVLRRISSEEITEPDDLSVKYSHPRWFVDFLVSRFGESFAEAFLIADNTEPEINRHSAFSTDEYYVQDNAAYESVRMAAPEPGMRVLDACAAPGGKSFTSAVLMGNKGEIVSCDIHGKKLRLVSDGAERLGIGIIRTRQADASQFIHEFSEGFDLVIADVPCSGFGVIRKKPEIRYRTREEISRLPEIQKRILSNVSGYVRPGGTLLYSTCTVFPEENEAVSDTVCSDGKFSLAERKTFYPNVDGTDGFYAAVLKRVK